MRAIGIATSVSLLSMLAGAPAMAQEQSWETQFLLIANPCLESQAPDRLQVCQQANGSLVTRAASYVGPLPGHENNVYRAMRGAIAIAIASEMGKADGARSKRSCEAMEQGWQDAALIDMAYSPQLVSELSQIKSKVAQGAAVCRKEFGRIFSWTPDLPAN